MSQQELEGTPLPDPDPDDGGASSIREYIVFEETTPDSWRRLETVSAGSPTAALKVLKPSDSKRYAVVAARYWQVGKPKVQQVTQVSIEFE